MKNELTPFIDTSHYKNIIGTMLDLAKQLGAEQAQVGAGCSEGLQVSVRLGEVETVEFNKDKAVGLTVYVNQQKGSASTTDLSPVALKSTVEAAINIAKHTEKDIFAGLADKQSMAAGVPDLDLYHPWNISVEEAKKLALECEQAALQVDPRINNSDGASLSTTRGYHVYGNSHGFIGDYLTSRHSLSCVVIGQEAGAKSATGMQRDYEYTISRQSNDLWSAQQVGVGAAQRTLNRLQPRKIKTQNVPVIFHSRIASSLIGHFLGAISGEALYRQASFLLDSINTPVFNNNITLRELPHLLSGLGSAPFDSEGVATHECDLVVDGILKTYLLNSYSARKLKLPNTGHAGGVRNLIVKPKTDIDFQAALKQIQTGLLVTELMGQGVNGVTGDYSRGAAGFWIENGEIQYPVHEITIAGNLKDMFKQILMVSNDIETRGTIQTGSIFLENMMVAGQ